MMTMSMMTRKVHKWIGQVKFRCIRPGVWRSVGGHYGILAMMGGVWELYKTDPAISGEPANDPDFDHQASALSMGELAHYLSEGE